MSPQPKTGFTLAELLIALAILGVIATFTIPKILAGQQSSEKKAVIKETIATLNEVLYKGIMNGELNHTNTGTYFAQHLNYVKQCTSDPEAQGCFAPSTLGRANQGEGYVLHNGAQVASLASYGGRCNGVAVDWNGNKGPNLDGDDQFQVVLVIDASHSDCSTFSNPKSGTVVAESGYETLFGDIWK